MLRRLKIKDEYTPYLFLFVSWVLSIILIYPEYLNNNSIIRTREVGTMLIVPFLTFIFWVSKRFSIKVTFKNLALIASHRRRRSSEVLESNFEKLLTRKLKSPKWLLLVLAACLAVVDSQFDFFYVSSTAYFQSGAFNGLILLQLVFFWMTLLNFAFTLYLSTNLCRIYTLRYSRVQLIEVEELTPLSSIVMMNFLLVSIPLCFYPLYSLFTTMNAHDKYILLALALASLGWTIHPLIMIYKNINVRKTNALSYLNFEIKQQLRLPENALDKTDRQNRLVDSEARVQRLSDLLLLKKELINVPTLPLNVPFAIKLFLLLLLPLLSWVGAGTLSTLLKPFVG